MSKAYRSGRVVKNTFDAADGSLSPVQSKRSRETYRNFPNGFIYNRAGVVTAMKLGNGCWTGLDVACVSRRHDAARARIARDDEFQAACNNLTDDHTTRKATKLA